jgi:sec-independent protein translocase protein TatA
MNFFGIGLPELAVIAAVGLLVFGPKRLPELGKTLGRTLKGFQSASQEFEKELRSAIASDDDSTTVATTASIAAAPEAASIPPAPLPPASAVTPEAEAASVEATVNEAPSVRATVSSPTDPT